MKQVMVLAALVVSTSALLISPRARTPQMNFFNNLATGLTKLQAGPYDEAAVRADVQRMIDRKPCVMFSLSTCPFCDETKKILSGMGVMYTWCAFHAHCTCTFSSCTHQYALVMFCSLDLDDEEGGMAMKAELAGIIGRTSLPAVFAGGKFLGGCNDGGLGGVATLNKKGELAGLLQTAGALSPTQRI